MKVKLVSLSGEEIITLPMIAGKPEVIVVGTKFYIRDNYSEAPYVYHETTGWRFLGEQEGEK